MAEPLPDEHIRVDKKRLKTRISCVKNWLEKYADEQFKFSIKEKKDEDYFSKLSDKEKEALELLKKAVEKSEDEEILSTAIFEIPKKLDMEMKIFFKLCYESIIGKEKGPKLANFILEIGKENILKIL